MNNLHNQKVWHFFQNMSCGELWFLWIRFKVIGHLIGITSEGVTTHKITINYNIITYSYRTIILDFAYLMKYFFLLINITIQIIL